MRVGLAVVVGCAAAATWAPGGAPAGEPQPWADPVFQEILIPRLEIPATLPLEPDQPPWNRAARLAGFRELGRQGPAGLPTWVYLCYDAGGLAVAFRCEGVPGVGLKAETVERDGPVWRDDCVELFCDPSGRRRSFYQFDVNAAGTLYDARGREASWNSGTEARVARDERGWTAVLRIRFEDLGVPAPRPGDVWPMNFARQGPGGGSAWTWVHRTVQSPGEFGRVVFGGDGAAVPRLRENPAPAIGPNVLLLDPWPQACCRVTGRDDRGRPRWTDKAMVDQDGRLSFVLGDDGVRRVDVELAGPDGRIAWRGWWPVATPAVRERAHRWLGRTACVREMLPRFPEALRGTVSDALDRLGPAIEAACRDIDDPARHDPATWRRIAGLVGDLDRELDDAACLAETLRFAPQAGFAVGLASSMQKVMIQDFAFEGLVAERARIRLARNEREALQVAVIAAGGDLHGVEVEVRPLRPVGVATDGPPPEVEVALVGHVKTGTDTPYDVQYRGWYPDPLLTFQRRCDVGRGEHVAFWLEVATSPATPPGDYAGEVIVAAEGCAPIRLGLDVGVWDFTLPVGSCLPTAFTYHQPEVARLYGDAWSAELAEKYIDIVLEHRLGPDHLYRHQAPEVAFVRNAVQRGMNAFNIVFAGSGGSRGHVLEVLERTVPGLERAGLLDRAYVYGFDEAGQDRFDQMRDLFGEVKRRYPGVRTMTTAQDDSFGADTGLRDVVDIWVPLTPGYDLEEADRLRAEGRRMWWYTCIVPVHPYPNWFIESPAIEARLLMGAMSWKYRVDGFLYYLMTSWTGNREPIRSGPRTGWNPASCENRRGQWANGDGSLLCAGPDGPLPTIRLKNIRDGLEDYAYLWVLSEELRQARKRGVADSTAGEAAALLEVPGEVVVSLMDFAGDPALLTAWREAVAEEINKLRSRRP